jgi:sigma-B regulation protein RsbU (phosphoserine phosphatase)
MASEHRRRAVAGGRARAEEEEGPAVGLRLLRDDDVSHPERRCRSSRLLARLRRRYRRLRAAHLDLLHELRLAENVHHRLLGRALPGAPEVLLAGALRPAHHLAGDFFNAVRLDGDRLGLYIGDVMGHGPAAALLGLFAMQAIRTKRPAGDGFEILPPELVLGQLNGAIREADFPGGPFVTMAYGVLDTAAATWTYCGAGHPPALLLRGGEPPRRLDSNSPLLGVLDLPYRSSRVALEPGDRLLFYSDGAESAHWARGGPGVAGLAATFAATGGDEGASAQDRVDEALRELSFPPGTPTDDVALLLAEFRP